MKAELSEYELVNMEIKAGYGEKPVMLTRQEFEDLIETAREFNELYGDEFSIEELKAEVADLEENIKGWDKELTEANDRINDLEKENDNLQEQVTELEPLKPEVELYRAYFEKV